MHSLFILLMPIDAGTKDDCVCSTAESYLSGEGFSYSEEVCEEGSNSEPTGEFGGGQSDWWQIGGRWRGWLQEVHLNQSLLQKFFDWQKKFREICPIKTERNIFYTYRCKKMFPKYPKWAKYFQEGDLASSFDNSCACMVVDDAIYDALKKQDLAESGDHFHCVGHGSTLLPRKQVVGRYKAIQIDYHS